MDFSKGGEALFATRQTGVPLSIRAYWPAALCRTKRPYAVSFADELQTAGNTAQDPFSIQMAGECERDR